MKYLGKDLGRRNGGETPQNPGRKVPNFKEWGLGPREAPPCGGPGACAPRQLSHSVHCGSGLWGLSEATPCLRIFIF